MTVPLCVVGTLLLFHEHHSKNIIDYLSNTMILSDSLSCLMLSRSLKINFFLMTDENFGHTNFSNSLLKGADEPSPTPTNFRADFVPSESLWWMHKVDSSLTAHKFRQ